MNPNHETTSQSATNNIVAAIRRNYVGASGRRPSWAKWYSRRTGPIAMIMALIAVTGILAIYRRLGLIHREVEELRGWIDNFSQEHQEKMAETDQIHRNIQVLISLQKQSEDHQRTVAKELQEFAFRVETSVTRLESTQRSTTTLILERLSGLSQAIVARGQNGAKAVEALARLLGTTGENPPQYPDWRQVGTN